MYDNKSEYAINIEAFSLSLIKEDETFKEPCFWVFPIVYLVGFAV